VAVVLVEMEDRGDANENKALIVVYMCRGLEIDGSLNLVFR